MVHFKTVRYQLLCFLKINNCAFVIFRKNTFQETPVSREFFWREFYSFVFERECFCIVSILNIWNRFKFVSISNIGTYCNDAVTIHLPLRRIVRNSLYQVIKVFFDKTVAYFLTGTVARYLIWLRLLAGAERCDH